MRILIAVVLVLLVVAAAITVLGIIGPFVAALGLVATVFIVLNPGGLGARLRQSPGWWGIPGMRRASAHAVPFAMALLLYTVPVPIAAFALVHSVSLGGTGPAVVTPSAVGGGPSSPVAVATPTPAATPTDTLPPPSTPQPTDTPTPAPTAPPTAPPPTAPPTPTATTEPANLCGAPPNPWGYNFCGGATITAPPSDFCTFFHCIDSFWQSTKGYVVECRDDRFSHSGGRKGACSQNGGVRRTLNP